MIMDCINNIAGVAKKQKELNELIPPSKKFGPDPAVLELIENEISLASDEEVLIDYNEIKGLATLKGVDSLNFNNTISLLITLSPMVIRYFPTDNGIKLKVFVSNFNAYKEKYPNISMTDQDIEKKSKGIAKTKEL